MRQEIIGTGFGGQGIQLMMRLFAKAIDSTKHLSALTLDYGAAARGGKSSAYVVVKEYQNDWPEITRADILIALSQEGFDFWKDRIKSNALIFYDPVLVNLTQLDKKKVYYQIPASEIAGELKDKRVVNMAILGGVIAIIKLVSVKETVDTLKKLGKYSSANEKALQKGYRKVRKMKKQKK
jgi:2-oxoglutarate ferredoxin oxidoreductase subunit gamma